MSDSLIPKINMDDSIRKSFHDVYKAILRKKVEGKDLSEDEKKEQAIMTAKNLSDFAKKQGLAK